MSVIRANEVARLVSPRRRRKGHHKQKEEGARHLQPKNAAHPPKGFQESAHAARQALRPPPSRMRHCPCICRSLCVLLSLSNLYSLYILPSSSIPRRLRSRRLRFAHQLLPGHPPGNPQPDPQPSPYFLSFHSDMIVAAEVFPPLFGLLSHMPTCYRAAMEVR